MPLLHGIPMGRAVARGIAPADEARLQLAGRSACARGAGGGRHTRGMDLGSRGGENRRAAGGDSVGRSTSVGWILYIFLAFYDSAAKGGVGAGSRKSEH